MLGIFIFYQIQEIYLKVKHLKKEEKKLSVFFSLSLSVSWSLSWHCCLVYSVRIYLYNTVDLLSIKFIENDFYLNRLFSFLQPDFLWLPTSFFHFSNNVTANYKIILTLSFLFFSLSLAAGNFHFSSIASNQFI